MKRSKQTKVMALVMAFGLALNSLPVSNVVEAKTAYTIGVGKSKTDSVNGKITKVTSGNVKVAKIEKVNQKSFKVSGKKAGKTTVTVQYGKKKKTIAVKVGATSIKKKTFSTQLEEGVKKVVSVTAANGAGDTLLWETSDDAIVSIQKKKSVVSSSKVAANTLSAHNPGKATITVTSKYTGKTGKFVVTVGNAQASKAPDTSPGVASPTENPATDEDTKATMEPNQTVATTGAIQVTSNITGVTLKVSSESDVIVAPVTLDDSKNTFLFPVLPNGTYTVTAVKDGYKTDFVRVVVKGGITEVNVYLTKETLVSVKAVHNTSLTRVQVDFSYAISSALVGDFRIKDVTIYAVSLSEDKSSAILTTSALTEGRTYEITVSDTIGVNDEAQVVSGTYSFVAKNSVYGMKLSLENEQTELLADSSVSMKVYVSVYDEEGYTVKDMAGVKIDFTTTAGKFENATILTKADRVVNTFISEYTPDRVDARITATISSAANEKLINLTASRNLVLNPSGSTGETGVYLNDVSITSGDRMILYFNKDVHVTDYTQNCGNLNDIYGYDADKLQILVYDAGAATEMTQLVEGSSGNRSVYALAPVEGNPKALCAYINLKGSGAALTNHARVVVKVTDRTQRYELSSTKYTNVNDISSPYITKVEGISLRTLRITFSEAVQNGDNAFSTVKADDIYRWYLDEYSLADNRYGYGDTYASNMSVGEFDKNTGIDHRNEVTLTLGKNPSGNQIYFSQGKHEISCAEIGDWCYTSSAKTNLCKAQKMNFEVKDNLSVLSATVKVYSPEQYLVTFDRAIDANLVKTKLKLQEYTGQYWTDTTKNSINVIPMFVHSMDTDAQQYMVEVTSDWTVGFNTSVSHKNYYNVDFRLHLDGGEVVNLENGLLNKEINLPLNDTMMQSLDTKSPTIEKVQQYGNMVYVTMSEPVQIPVITEETPSENTIGTGISNPSVTFISPDNKETIPGTIVSMTDEYDMTFHVVPATKLTAGIWRVSISGISDDVGNTAQTLYVDSFRVSTTIDSLSEFVPLWILAIPRGMTDPLTGLSYTRDKVYVKFSQRYKTYGNATNAVDTSNYCLNNASWPNATSILASLQGYNTTANLVNNYTDLVQIDFAGGTITDNANTFTISSTIESIYGNRLGDSGLKTLDKRFTNATDYYFAYNYKTASAGEVTDVVKLSQFMKNRSYVGVNYRLATSDDAQKALNTSLTVVGAGVFNLTSDYDGSSVTRVNEFKELNISTLETGTILVKNAKFANVKVDAPNAEVVFDNVTIGEKLTVVDVLDGTLKLTNHSACNEMIITDYQNGGKVETDGTSSVSITYLDTVGTFTLNMPATALVVIEKPGKIIFEAPVTSLTLARTGVGAQLVNRTTGNVAIFTTLTDETSSNDLRNAVDNVRASLTDLETKINAATSKDFTVSKATSVTMSMKITDGTSTNLTFNGSRMQYLSDETEILTISVTASCNINHNIYSETISYRIQCDSGDISILP